MYPEFVGVIVFSLFSVYFVLEEDSPELVISISTVGLAGAGVLKHRLRYMSSKKHEDVYEHMDTLMAGGIWLLWLLYGELVHELPPLFDGVSLYVHGCMVLCFVFYTHFRSDMRRENMWIPPIFMLTMVILLIPHQDAGFRGISLTLMLLKLFLFYGLFITSEIATKMELVARGRVGDKPTRNDRISADQVKILQSVWVLFIYHVFLVGIVGQVILLAFEIRKRKQLQDARSRTTITLEVVVDDDPLPPPPSPQIPDQKTNHPSSNGRVETPPPQRRNPVPIRLPKKNKKTKKESDGFEEVVLEND